MPWRHARPPCLDRSKRCHGPLATGEMNADEVELRTYTSDRITLNVAPSGASFMVMSMAWNPFGRRILAPLERAIVRTDHALMGIAVEPGDSIIVLTYEPPCRYLAWLNGVLPPSTHHKD